MCSELQCKKVNEDSFLVGSAIINVQCAQIVCPTGNGKKLSSSQACSLAQLCLAAAYFLSISCGANYLRALYMGYEYSITGSIFVCHSVLIHVDLNRFLFDEYFLPCTELDEKYSLIHGNTSRLASHAEIRDSARGRAAWAT